jgi:signal transduction histidine kinase
MVPRSTFHFGRIRNDRVVRWRVRRWLAAIPALFLVQLAAAAEAHGGTIRAERGAYGGAVFHVQFPSHEASESMI